MISHFEALLPVALALGVGKTWANTFAHYLSSTGAVSHAFAGADWGSVHHFSEACRTALCQRRIAVQGAVHHQVQVTAAPVPPEAVHPEAARGRRRGRLVIAPIAHRG
ncbi:Uncharacterised protein [Klebsiella michiganensis]|nr:Uncharacterised protein [Klebsiella michiganensis]